MLERSSTTGASTTKTTTGEGLQVDIQVNSLVGSHPEASTTVSQMTESYWISSLIEPLDDYSPSQYLIVTA